MSSKVNSIVSDSIVTVVLVFQAHVCVQQTALDLLERNYDVHIVADGVSARSMTDRMFSFEVNVYCKFIISQNVNANESHTL